MSPSRQPPHCVPETYTNATSWYKIFTTARDSDTKYTQDYNPFWCYKGAIGKVYHTLNPKLTVIVPDVSQQPLSAAVPFYVRVPNGTVSSSAQLLTSALWVPFQTQPVFVDNLAEGLD